MLESAGMAVWRGFCEPYGPGNYMEWVLAANHWIQSFLELEVLLSDRNFEGFALHRRFCVSTYTWNYFEGPEWCEEDLYH